jgi:hypothetical protein
MSTSLIFISLYSYTLASSLVLYVALKASFDFPKIVALFKAEFILHYPMASEPL